MALIILLLMFHLKICSDIMKLHQYLLFHVLIGTMPLSSAPEVQSKNELFPVFGITLGVTSECELKKIGDKDEDSNYYIVRGQKFWVEEGKFDRMYLTKPSEMPLKWRNLNFSWYNTYDEWLEALEKLGFEVCVSQSPTIREYRGADSFFAELNAKQFGATPVALKLSFKYSDKTSTDHEGTLYSIRVTQPK